MFLAAKTRPLTEDETRILAALIMSDLQNTSIIHPQIKELFAYKVLEKRLQAYKILDKVDEKVLVFCAAVSNNPAEAVMWGYTLALILTKQKKVLTINDWCNYFPMGVPTEEERERCWVEQKQARTDATLTDNKIDDYANWPIVNWENINDINN